MNVIISHYLKALTLIFFGRSIQLASQIHWQKLKAFFFLNPPVVTTQHKVISLYSYAVLHWLATLTSDGSNILVVPLRVKLGGFLLSKCVQNQQTWLLMTSHRPSHIPYSVSCQIFIHLTFLVNVYQSSKISFFSYIGLALKIATAITVALREIHVGGPWSYNSIHTQNYVAHKK